MMNKNLHNIDDYKTESRKRLSLTAIDYYDGAANAESSLNSIPNQFNNIKLKPRLMPNY